MLQGKTPLLIALVLGILAALISTSAIQSAENRVREGWDPVRVVCATGDVKEGDELSPDVVSTCEMPSRFVTSSFIVQRDDEDKVSQVVGQRVLVPLRAGDPILFSHFEAQRDFLLSEGIPLKARAVAVEVEEKAAVAQWVRPNDHVDVIGTFRDPETRELVAVTLLENVIVLATGRINGMSVYVPEEDKRYSHVVLLVGTQEAEILALAQETGSLTLALRNQQDLEVAQARKKTDGKTLLTGQAQELFQERVKWQTPTVEVIQGRTRERTAVGTGAPVTP